MGVRLVLCLVLALLVSSCGQDGVQSVVENPEVDASRMTVSPATTVPGTVVEVRFPEADSRGPGFVVDRAVRRGWSWVWAVHHDPDVVQPNIWTAEEFEERGVEWDDGPSISSVRPHKIPVPEGTEAGRYRVCTATRREPLCAEFEVLQR